MYKTAAAPRTGPVMGEASGRREASFSVRVQIRVRRATGPKSVISSLASEKRSGLQSLVALPRGGVRLDLEQLTARDSA